MSKSAVLLEVALCLVMFVAPAFAQTQTVTGQLIDIGNYVDGHPPSQYAGVHGRACALEGFEVGLLTTDGKVYHITGDVTANKNAKLAAHMLAKTVTVTGDASEKDGQMMIAATDVK